SSEAVQQPAGDPVRWVCGRLAYDGTDYYGFQFQVGVSTIQAALEQALARVARPMSRVLGAGRTDRGVHARGQVVAVRVAWRHPVEKLQDAWNAHLPHDLALRDLTVAPDGFHPRFSAERRIYFYAVVESGRSRDRLPLPESYAWVLVHAQDLKFVNAAGALLVGELDFATSGNRTKGEGRVRSVRQVVWAEEPADRRSGCAAG